MVIDFLNYQNDLQYESTRREFEEFWDQNGDSVLKSIEKYGGFKFSSKSIKVFIYPGFSYSRNIARNIFIRSTYSPEIGRGVLIHELCHQLLHDNGIPQGKFDKTGRVPISEKLASHKLIDLILYEIWVDLFGEAQASKSVEFEKKLLTDGEPIYRTAWDWALSFDKEGRQREFQKLVKESRLQAKGYV